VGSLKKIIIVAVLSDIYLLDLFSIIMNLGSWRKKAVDFCDIF